MATTDSDDRPVRLVSRLHKAGLTSDDMMRLLNYPELVTKLAETAKALLGELVWGDEKYYTLTSSWSEIAPGVQIMRPYDSNPNRCFIRVEAYVSSPGMRWGNIVGCELTNKWLEVVSGVRVYKHSATGDQFLVRTLETP